MRRISRRKGTYGEYKDKHKGYEFISAEVEMVPSTYTEITDDEIAVKMQKLLDSLEDNDDVQNVWHNWENPLDA